MADSKKNSKKKDAEIQRLMPQAEEIEGSVLGAMMMNLEAFGKAYELIDDDCFYKRQNKLVFLAMRSLFNENKPIDPLTVAEKLREMGKMDEVGGAYYLTELTDMVSFPASIIQYAETLREKSILRRLISLAGDIADDCYLAQTNAYNLLDKTQERLFQLSFRRDQRGFQHIEPIISDTFKMIDKFHTKKGIIWGVETGYTKLDALTTGFHQGDFIVLAGRPSMGKTALALNIAAKVAGDGLPVGFFSLEMNAQMIGYRILCAEARVDSYLVRTGRLPQEEWPNLTEMGARLSEIPLYIDESSNLSILELRSRARRLAVEKGVQLIIVDYLQIMQPPPEAENQQQGVATISRQLKSLAKELNIPVIALSQLSRAAVQREGDAVPRLEHLRDSGAIEQDADVVMFIHRPAQLKAGKEEEMDPKELRKTDIIVAKQRNGPTGKVPLVFLREYARFDNPTGHEDEEKPEDKKKKKPSKKTQKKPDDDTGEEKRDEPY